MDASSQPAAARVNDARRLVRDAAGQLSAHARAGVVRPDRRRHLRLPRDPDRAARVPVPRAEPDRDALDRRLRRRPRSCVADPHWLPFAENALDLIVLPHALEFTDRAAPAAARGLPRAAARGADRHRRASTRSACSAPSATSAASRRRRGTATSSRSTGSRTGWRCSASRSPAAASTATCRRSQPGPWRARCGFFESAGDRWWPIAGGVYYLRATKKRDRHARDHAGVGAAQADARDGAAAGARVHRAAGRPVSAAGHPEGDAASARRDGAPATDVVTIHTDGACKGNPGPGGWGALLAVGRPRERALRRRAGDDQQPDGAHRGDPRAREPQARLRRRWSTPTRST